MQMLYIIGSGSLHYNEELRFSLRTVEKFCPEIEKIVVVGEPLHFLSNKVDFHYIQEAKGNKEYRIGMKIYNACKNGYIKGDFIFMNDDFFFTRAYDWSVNYAKGDLPSGGKENYPKALNDTREYLLSIGKSINHFDCHTPIIYNSEKFIELLPHLEKSKEKTNGFVVKSLYGNIYELKPTKYTDCKLSTLQTESDFRKIKDTPIISCSDGSWQNGVRKYLKNLYPNKSKYEQ